MRRAALVFLFSVLLALSWAARAAALPSADPEAVGMSSQRLERLGDALERDVGDGVIPGAVVLIARRGAVAWHEAFGYRDRAAGAPMERDSIFRIYSMTKPLFSAAAMTLVEEGALVPSEPIARHLPVFAEMSVGVAIADPETGGERLELVPAKRPITLQDLLRHTSGLTYAFIGAGPVKEAYKAAGLASFSLDMTIMEYAGRVARLPLLWQPGTTWDYGRSTDILGAVMEAAAGEALDAFMARRIFEPLGMADTAFWVPETGHDRIAEPQADPETGAVDDLIDIRRPPKMLAGGHGLVSTAADYARFCQAMLNGGALDGVRVLSRKTVEYMTADHLGAGISKAGTAYLPGPGYGFGLGFGVRAAAGESPWPGSVGEYFWGGYAGTYFWIDPSEELVVVYMMQSVKNRVRYRMLLRNLVLQAIVD